MNRMNRFKALEFPQDPTDYEEFEDVAPYNKLEGRKWTSLQFNRHPLYYMITNRFNGTYDGKLMQRELNDMKERIKELQESLQDYIDKIYADRKKAILLIREQKKLCGEKCEKELQAHLDKCTGFNGKYKCTENYVSYDCEFKENGRCSHFYEIKRADEELEHYEYYEYDKKDRIQDLEIEYERALAVKENRLQEYLDNIYDDW
jgi:hypothetical protein